jgi:hypothetical protein
VCTGSTHPGGGGCCCCCPCCSCCCRTVESTLPSPSDSSGSAFRNRLGFVSSSNCCCVVAAARYDEPRDPAQQRGAATTRRVATARHAMMMNVKEGRVRLPSEWIRSKRKTRTRSTSRRSWRLGRALLRTASRVTKVRPPLPRRSISLLASQIQGSFPAASRHLFRFGLLPLSLSMRRWFPPETTILIIIRARRARLAVCPADGSGYRRFPT